MVEEIEISYDDVLKSAEVEALIEFLANDGAQMREEYRVTQYTIMAIGKKENRYRILIFAKRVRRSKKDVHFYLTWSSYLQPDDYYYEMSGQPEGIKAESAKSMVERELGKYQYNISYVNPDPETTWQDIPYHECVLFKPKI